MPRRSGEMRASKGLTSACLDHRRRRLHRIPSVRGAARRRATRSSFSTTCRPARSTTSPISKGRPGFEYLIDTVDNEPLLAELIDRSDVVFHLAAAVGVKLIVEQPVHTIETNVHGTEVVLKHANKKKKLVVIASTSEVYGKSDDVPFREDADLVMGATTEAPLGLRLQQGDRRVPGARLLEGAQAAGDHRPVLQHRRSAADRPVRHGHPELRAAGARRRTDHRLRRRHAVALVHARGRRRRRPDQAGRRAEARSARSSTSATSEEVTISALAERVRAMTGSKSAIKLIPYDEAYESGFEDMPRRVPDLTKIAAMIGYKTRTIRSTTSSTT